MCDPVTGGLILSAVGGGAQALNTRSTLKRKDRETARGIRAQGEISRRSNERVNEQIAEIAGATGEGEKAEALGGFLDALRASKGATEGALPAIPGANERFAERVGGGKARLAESGAGQAERLSVIEGILNQRLGEGSDVARTASDVRALGDESRAQDFLTQLRVSEQRNNPLIDLLGGVSKGAGSALALGVPKGVNPLLAALKKGTIVDSPVTNATRGIFAAPGTRVS